MIVYAGLTSYASIPDTGDATYAFVDATGSRVALATGSTRAWTAFDLHGNLVATTADSATTIVAALRYDPYGQVLDSYTAGSGATETPWRFQGRLDLSPDADDPLYDYGARRYRPALGAFTQLDSYAGQAVNPLSMNRFLYAHANPTTLIDPTGHCVITLCIDGYVTAPTQGKNAAATKSAAAKQVAGSSGWAPQSATNATPKTLVPVSIPSAVFPELALGVSSTAVSALNLVLSQRDLPKRQRHPCAALDCSPMQIEGLTPAQKLELVRLIEMRMGAATWFTGVEDIVRFMTDYGLLGTGSWHSRVDSYIIGAIQDGAALADPTLRGRPMAGVIGGTDTWKLFFEGVRTGMESSELLGLWGSAEQAATDYGVARASGVPGDEAGKFALIAMGDVWRAGVAGAPGRYERLQSMDELGLLQTPEGAAAQLWLGVQNDIFDPRTPGFAYAAAVAFYELYNATTTPMLPPIMPLAPGLMR